MVLSKTSSESDVSVHSTFASFNVRSSLPRFKMPFPQSDTKSIGASSGLRQGMAGNDDGGIQQIQLPGWREHASGGVTVVMKERMDAGVFARWLRASISTWKQQGKKLLWIKLLTEYSHLFGIVLEEGFRYHHSEVSYMVFAPWLPVTPNLIPVNACHGVRAIAFVLNDEREVLVVPENSGRFKGTRKLPTGVVNEDEDICHAVVRVAKEETGVSNEFYVVSKS
ncbi:nudix hydrolase 7-like [Eucalyptus grandis]|uniref:nudix hydrolase 7-like n=1 Tax=Eucalyptus grandis TaxID=71139 RepID=UPI00192EDACE|nr:nudix hydrolase 7-like [Eucalyptus grandis]